MSVFRRLMLLGFTMLMALVLTMAACGGDDDDTGGDDSSDVTATEDSGDDGGDDGDNGDEETPEGDDDEPTAEGDDSGDGDDGVSGDGPDACLLITEEEIEGILGEAVDEVTNNDIPPFFGCSWQTEALNFVDVQLIGRDDGGESFYNLSIGDGVEKDEVDGLGDQAQYLLGALPLLEVLNDDWYLSVAVSSVALDQGPEKAAAIALAEIALDRLP